MCIDEASSKSCFCRNFINAMKRIQCQKPLNGRREGTYKPQMPTQKNGRGRLKVEALKNCGAKGTTNPWPRCSRLRGKTADGRKMHRGPVWEDSVDDSADSLLG